MSRTLSRNKRMIAILLGWFAFSLLMPPVASAGSDWHRGDDHRDNYRNNYRSHGISGHRGYRYGRHDRYAHHRRYEQRLHARSRYYCAACDHGFHSRSAFHSHLSSHHHVAPWLLPFAIVEHALGWIFYG